MLTTENIRYITAFIDRAEISFSHLREDLVDHVCCDLEWEMEHGSDFTSAFEKVRRKVGIADLQRIQESTLLLINKNYRMMKTTMKISGVLATSLLLIGSLFKVNHLSGASIMLISGFALLCLFFLPSAFYVMHRENKSNNRILLYLSAFLGNLLFAIGILFKLMHWPGAGLILPLSIIMLSFIFSPLLWLELRKNIENNAEKQILFVGIISGSAYLIGFLFKWMH